MHAAESCTVDLFFEQSSELPESSTFSEIAADANWFSSLAATDSDDAEEEVLVPACSWFSVLGLEVVLLASPFSTVVEADDDLVLLVVTVLVMVVVVVFRTGVRLTTLVGTADVALMVGVTVADGLVETSFCLLSASGLMGITFVEAPNTFGRGAVEVEGRGVALATARGFTWPIAAGFLESWITGEGPRC